MEPPHGRLYMGTGRRVEGRNSRLFSQNNLNLGVEIPFKRGRFDMP
jgi:hypothetical protein